MLVKHNDHFYPAYQGQPLCWSIGSYMTNNEAEHDYPRARTVIRAMIRHRPDQLETERQAMLKASFDIFGNNAQRELDLIESIFKGASC